MGIFPRKSKGTGIADDDLDDELTAAAMQCNEIVSYAVRRLHVPTKWASRPIRPHARQTRVLANDHS
jgi:hypothetical protein